MTDSQAPLVPVGTRRPQRVLHLAVAAVTAAAAAVLGAAQPTLARWADTAPASSPVSSSLWAAPTITPTYVGDLVTFTWDAPGATSFEVSYMEDGSQQWSAPLTQTTSSLTRTIPHGHSGQVRVVASNSESTAPQATGAHTTALYHYLRLGPGWASNNGSTMAPLNARPPSLTKTTAGVVSLTGVVQRAGSGQSLPSGTIIATLPPQYRPALPLEFQTYSGTGSSAQVGIRPDGSVRLLRQRPTSTTPATIGLDGITYRVGANFTPLTLANGWTNTTTEPHPLSLNRDDYGRVFLQGAITPGTVGPEAPIAVLPADARPDRTVHPGASADAIAATAGINAPASLTTTAASSVVTTTGMGVTDPYTGAPYKRVSIASMFYDAAAPGTWTDVAPLNGWTNFNSTQHRAVAVRRAPDGLVTVSAVVSPPAGFDAAASPAYSAAAHNTATARVIARLPVEFAELHSGDPAVTSEQERLVGVRHILARTSSPGQDAGQLVTLHADGYLTFDGATPVAAGQDATWVAIEFSFVPVQEAAAVPAPGTSP